LLPAALEALADAGLGPDDLPEETSISIGSGAGEMRAMEVSLGPPEGELPLDLVDPLQPPNSTSKLARRSACGAVSSFVNACHGTRPSPWRPT
jgi:hypothetical protein